MDFISTVLTALITSGVFTAFINQYIKTKELGEQRRWEIKREACLEALEIIDARFADYPWISNEKLIKVDKQKSIPTAKIRSCFNKLVLACKDSSVPKAFEKCLNLKIDNRDVQSLSMSDVVPFRNAIRKELGLGKDDLITDISWITYITWKHAKKKVI